MSTTEPVFALRQLQEKCREKNKDLDMVFVDLEKAFDRIPRDLIWWCLRKKGVPEEYVKITKKDERKLNSAEMMMLRWARGKTRLDHIRNEDIRK